MIVQPLDNEYLEKAGVCAKCGGRIVDGDTLVDLKVADFYEDGRYVTQYKEGIHPTVHYKCLVEEDRPVVISYD